MTVQEHLKILDRRKEIGLPSIRNSISILLVSGGSDDRIVVHQRGLPDSLPVIEWMAKTATELRMSGVHEVSHVRQQQQQHYPAPRGN